MKIRKDFFNYFKGYDPVEVAKALLDLSDKNKTIILNIWGENATFKYDERAKRIIYIIKRKISKKDLMDELDIYDKFELNNILSLLTDREKQALLKEYYIENMVPKENISEEEITFNERTILKLKNQISLFKKKYKIKSFFKIFKAYDRTLVERVFNTLNDSEKELLYKKFGKDFNNIDIKELTYEENNYITQSIIRKMKRNLNDIVDGKIKIFKIEDLYSGIDKSILLIRSEYLCKKDRELYYRYFGFDFNKEALLKEKDLKALNKEQIRKVLEKKTPLNKKIRPLMEILSSYKLENETDEELNLRIKKVLATLSIEEMTFLKKKYGEDLNGELTSGRCTIEEDYFLTHHIVDRIKRMMKLDLLNESKNLLKTLDISNRKLYLQVFNYLNEDEIKLLEKKYGVNFNRNNKLSSDEEIEVLQLLTKMRNIIKVNNVVDGVSFDKMSLVIDACKFKKYRDLCESFNEKTSMAIIIVIYLDNIINNEELIKITGCNKKYINELINKYDLLRKNTNQKRLIKK